MIEEISKYKIAQLTDTSIEYIDRLPFDIQEELIDIYECYKQLPERKLQEHLLSALKLINDKPETDENKEINTDKRKFKINLPEKKPSLLAKLRHYQEELKHLYEE